MIIKVLAALYLLFVVFYAAYIVYVFFQGTTLIDIDIIAASLVALYFLVKFSAKHVEFIDE